MERTVTYELYSDPESAQRACQALEAAGFPRSEILVLCPEPYDEYEFFQRDRPTWMPWLSALGGLMGGIGGYLLAAFTQTAYPIHTGGMPIVTRWTNGIVTYELTMLSAILTTLVTLIFGARLGSYSGLYDPQISQGKILVGVAASPEQVVGLRQLLSGPGTSR